MEAEFIVGKKKFSGGFQEFYEKNIYTNYHYKVKFLSCNFAHDINQEGRQHICAYF